MSQSRPDQLRGLKALVAFLGVLVVLGTAVVVGVVIKRLYASPAPTSTAAPAWSPAPTSTAAPAWSPSSTSTAALAWSPSPAGVPALPAGSRIAGIAGAGNAIAIWVAGPQGGQIFLLDPQTGRLKLALTAPP